MRAFWMATALIASCTAAPAGETRFPDLSIGEVVIADGPFDMRKLLVVISNSTGEPIDARAECTVYGSDRQVVDVARLRTDNIPPKGKAGQSALVVGEAATADCRITAAR